MVLSLPLIEGSAPAWRALILAANSLRDHRILRQAPGAGFATGADPARANPNGLADVFLGHAHLGGRALRGLLEEPIRVLRGRGLANVDPYFGGSHAFRLAMAGANRN